jgi:hypothetical protein
MQSMCFLCRAHQESSQHIFVTCSFTLQVKAYVMQILSGTTPTDVSYSSPTEVSKILSGERHMYWRQLEATTMFVIWRERCRKIFIDKAHDIIKMSREILSKQKLWFHE